MAGFLMTVTFNHGTDGTPGTILLGVQDAFYPTAVSAITGSKAAVTALMTVRDGVAPTSIVAAISQTR